MKSNNNKLKMSIRKSAILSTVGVFALSVASASHASVTDDLIQILQAKGLVSATQASALKEKSRQEQRARDATIRQQVQSEQSTSVQKAVKAEAKKQVQAAVSDEFESFGTAKDSLNFVRALDNGGVGFQAGNIKFQFGGNINVFTTFESVDSGASVVNSGLVATGNDNLSIRNGLLPNAFTFDVSTTQNDFDIALRVGLYPGTNNITSAGALGANSGGGNFSLGTAGIDARQAYFTIGRADLGTLKGGRDIAIFGRNAIFSDFSIFGVGGTGFNANGGNLAPANTSLGRIGLGYIYSDFQPQISYKTPSYNGLTLEAGIFQAFSALALAGADSATVGRSEAPQFQAQVQYDGKIGDASLTLWGGFATLAYDDGPAGDQRGYAGEAGLKLSAGKFGLVASGYLGDGVGTTAFGFDAIAANGETRDSFGGYIQGTYAATDKLTFALSYGGSFLDEASGESAPTLVESNQSIIGAARYSLTKWVNLQGEVVYSEAENQAGGSNDSLAFSLGSILFF